MSVDNRDTQQIVPVITQQACGVHIHATPALRSPLVTAAAVPDVTFHFSADPIWQDDEWQSARCLSRDMNESARFWAELRQSGEELWYTTQWNGDLRIRPGQIVGYTRFPRRAQALEIDFLEMGLAFYLGQQGVPVFHGAAVAIDGAAVALLADSGSGKSSLALALLQHGCSLFSDDVVAVHGPEHLVWPGHFEMRLHADTAAALLRPADCQRIYPRYPRSKQYTNVQAWGPVQNTPLPLGAVYLVDAQEDALATSITPVQGYAALQALTRNELGRIGGDHSTRLARLAKLARCVPVNRLMYRRGYDNLSRVADTLISDVQARTQALDASYGDGP